MNLLTIGLVLECHPIQRLLKKHPKSALKKEVTCWNSPMKNYM